jgi:signal transduction histidine kinase
MNQTKLSKKYTILVVDDTPDNLALMSNLLKDEYKVKIASTGEKALQITLSDSPPDLILLDIMMPDIDGYEVCRRIKFDANTMNIPVIFLTAKVEVEDEKKGLDLGAVDYITKPISPPIVMARVKSHLALRAKNIELEMAKAVADKANLAKSEFLSSMSHELRSPLNAILGFAQLMDSESPPPPPNQKESLTNILQAGWHLLKLINEILDLAKVESGQVPMSAEPVSLEEVMLECQNMISPQAQQRGIKLSLPTFENAQFVHADRTRLKQIIINLLSNAIKYNSVLGTVSISCNTSTQGRVRISVKDTGLGLSPEQVAQLFQPFNRLGRDVAGEEGTGIGLVVAKRLVEMMGGFIGVESELGVGSTFWFELITVDRPILSLSNTGATALDKTRPLIHVSHPHTLLYVDDNPSNLRLVEQVIARHPKIKLHIAVNGNDGIRMANELRPDVVMMDINMPGINGFEAMRILHSNPSTSSIPVIAVSANAMPIDIERGLKAGFFQYLTKPIKVDEFMLTLEMALECIASKPALRR